jgi:hypothetical protein
MLSGTNAQQDALIRQPTLQVDLKGDEVVIEFSDDTRT